MSQASERAEALDERLPRPRMTPPAASSASALAAASPSRRSVTIMTGPSESVENSRAVGGVRSRRSNTTRMSGRTRWTARAVSSGSSTSTVSDPTATASTAARRICALGIRRPGGELRAHTRMRRHARVQARGGLEKHQRALPPLDRHKRCIEPRGLLCHEAVFDHDPVALAARQTPGR